ncbi:MAG: DUF6340 family protein [Bacteroidota bacterium]
MIVLLVLLFVVSCTSTKTITIEIPQASQKELPQRIQSLLIINRTVDEKYSDLETDSIQRLFYQQNFDYDTVIYDLTAVDTTLKALGELLFESGRYDFVIPENRFIKSEKNTFFSKEMPWEQVKEICEIYNTDAVLSMDMYSTRISTDFDEITYFDPYNNGFVSNVTAEMKVLYNALFRIYDPVEEKILIREFFKDTLVWEDMNSSPRVLFSQFTPVKQALSEAGIAMAIDFSEKISTIWRVERRLIFIKGDSQLKQAGTFIDTGDWNSAMAIWREISEKARSKSVKSKAQFNVAIGFELQGNLDEAISWALDSYNTMYHPATYQYLEILKHRKREIKKQ